MFVDAEDSPIRMGASELDEELEMALHAKEEEPARDLDSLPSSSHPLSKTVCKVKGKSIVSILDWGASRTFVSQKVVQ